MARGIYHTWGSQDMIIVTLFLEVNVSVIHFITDGVDYLSVSYGKYRPM